MVIRIYAWVVCGAGLLMAGWGPMWLGVNLPGVPYGMAAVVRMLAAAMILTGCFGAALAEVREPRALRRGMHWFLGAQVVAFGLIRVQVSAVWGREELVRWMVVLTGLLYVLVWVVLTAEGVFNEKTWKPQTLFGGTEERELRSKYEEQIRAAAAQEERHRLARELHDAIKQQIFVAQTAAATAEARYGVDDEGTRAALGEVRSAARAAMAEMEAMLDQLRAAPLENAGLAAAVKEQCEALGLRTGAEVEFVLGAMPSNDAMPPGSQQAMFRVAQEALANVGRHARAGKVEVRLERIGNEVRLRVMDDGAGFDTNTAARGMGLRNMRARAEEHGGVLEVVSGAGRGTVVEMRIPCAAGMEGEAERYLKFALVWVASGFIMGVMVFALGRWTVLNVGLLGVALVGTGRSLMAWRRLKKEEAAR